MPYEKAPSSGAFLPLSLMYFLSGEPMHDLSGVDMTIVSLIFVNRSFSASLVTALRRRNPAFVLVLLAVTTMLGLTLLWPFARGLFRFGPLHLDDLALTLCAGVFVLVVLELLKPLWRERLRA